MGLYVQNQNMPNLAHLLYGDADRITPYKGLNSYLNTNYVDEFWFPFYNLFTATSSGLDNWGKILGITRNLYIPQSPQSSFGVTDTLIPQVPADDPKNFNNGGFFSGTSTFTAMDDNIFTCMLLLRYRTLTSNMTLINILDIMNMFFEDLNTYNNPNNQIVSVQDNLANMSITYTFTENLTLYQQVLFGYNNQQNPTNYLPKPMGMTPIFVV